MTAVITDERFIHAPRTFGGIELTVIGLLAGFIYALVTVAREWSGPLQQVPEIHLEARYLALLWKTDDSSQVGMSATAFSEQHLFHETRNPRPARSDIGG